jgi:CPA2 family monovalent cation:H+ antiporter-2
VFLDNNWQILLEIIMLLMTATVLGALFERVRVNAILGYLLAGTVLGPHAFHLVENIEQVEVLAELGVALLLFTIGLEFSWHKLKQLGVTAMAGGTLQVTLTVGTVVAICMFWHIPIKAGIALGCMVALSSTACVIRLLMSRSEIDSIAGRNSVGILLLQDIAIVPMMILLTAFSGNGTFLEIVIILAQKCIMIVPLFIGFVLIFKFVLPAILGIDVVLRNREFPIVIGVVMALFASFAAHRFGLSPALGAFLAGVLLGESPFATQIRSDVIPIRTLLVTLFFSTVGMLADPVWMINHFTLMISVVILVIIIKVAITWGVMRLFRQLHSNAIATGLCLSQVGEFSFVLAKVGESGGVIDQDMFKLIVGVSIITLFLTPFMVANAMPIGVRFQKIMYKRFGPKDEGEFTFGNGDDTTGMNRPYIILIGFGPAGEAVGKVLQERDVDVTVLDLNPRMTLRAKSFGFNTFVGGASHEVVLKHLKVSRASMIVITIPDPAAIRRIIPVLKRLSPDAEVIVRSRYHVYRDEFMELGATQVIDEEVVVGRRLAAYMRRQLKTKNNIAPQE